MARDRYRAAQSAPEPYSGSDPPLLPVPVASVPPVPLAESVPGTP